MKPDVSGQRSLREAAREGSRKRQAEATETVTASCGHQAQFELYARDPYRVQRRKKITDAPCRDCRQKAGAAREAADRARAASRPKKRRAPREDLPGRLPNGANVHVAYDGDKQEWSGQLLVPGFPPVQARKSGLFRLLITLDGMFRIAAAQTPAAAVVR